MEFNSFVSSTYGRISANSAALGRALHGGEPTKFEIRAPLRMLNRHGLIAGSTGTGKSRAAQRLAEQLSAAGVPVVFTDVKGDVSDFAAPGDRKIISSRCSELKCAVPPSSFPASYFSLSGRLTPLRIRLDSINPALLAKFMGLNPTQESHLSVALIYAKQKRKPVIDLEDLESLLLSIRANPNSVPGISTTTLDVILRTLTQLKASGLNSLFSATPVEIGDLLQKDKEGRGFISVLSLSDFRDRPEVFSAAAAFLLNHIFNSLDDIGDQEKPRLAIFFDEAHYLFLNANRTLVDTMTTILRQIRSKGVAVFFITQEPGDISEGVLGQLSNRIQFAMRAFTQKDLDEVRALVRGFPPSHFYKMEDEMKSLEVGTSFVSLLNERGELLPPVKVAWYPPASSMGIATDAQMLSLMRKSPLFKKYAKTPGKSKTAYAPPPSVPGKKPAAMEAAEEAPGFLSFLGLLARKLIDFIGWVLDKLIKGILNFIGWLLHKLIFAPLIGIFHTLTFGIFRRRQHRRRR